MREELIRWGTEPDLFVPQLVSARILTADGTALRQDEGDDDTDRERRVLAVLEEHLRLSLPRTVFTTDASLSTRSTELPPPTSKPSEPGRPPTAIPSLTSALA